MPPHLHSNPFFWLGLYALIGLFLNLVIRCLEMVMYLRKTEEHGSRLYSVYRLKEAWNLERDYDVMLFTNIVCGLFWPIGVITLPFIYWNEWWYMIAKPFKMLNITFIPKWLTVQGFVDRLNKKVQAKNPDRYY